MLTKVVKQDGFPFMKHLSVGTLLEAEVVIQNHPNVYSVTTAELIKKGVPPVEIYALGTYFEWFFSYDELYKVEVLPSLLNKLEKMREQSKQANR